MLVDANLLLYATDSSYPMHDRAQQWLTGVMTGNQRVGLAWSSIGAFLRIATNPRICANPLTSQQAWEQVEAWLGADPTWIPPATERTAAICGNLVVGHRVTSDLVPDAMLAALALEHGLTIYSADTDFARFAEIRWVNPLTEVAI
ncbi:MAG: PIN domain-containing protein [bacterium]|nr:PIN domain-containing protein [bacterium]